MDTDRHGFGTARLTDPILFPLGRFSRDLCAQSFIQLLRRVVLLSLAVIVFAEAAPIVFAAGAAAGLDCANAGAATSTAAMNKPVKLFIPNLLVVRPYGTGWLIVPLDGPFADSILAGAATG